MNGAPLDAVGQVLTGTYKIERRIAAGGMGVVYEASHVRLPRKFAIKVLSRSTESLESGIALERFKREAQVASAIKNPHVVQIYDYQIAEGGFPYIVMEMLDGEDLAQRLKRGARPTPLETVRIVTAIADALDAAHALGVIHRDLKPANIFMSTQPTRDFVKVLDFGVSKMMSWDTITRTDALVGTPLYMSPEQAGGTGDLTAASDVFALGAIAYELLTGARAFAGKSIPAILYQVVHAEPTPVSKSLPPEVSDVDAVFAQVLSKDRSMRYASAGRFATALEIALSPLEPVDPLQSSDEQTRVRMQETTGTASIVLLSGPVTPKETPISIEPATPPPARLQAAPDEPTRLARRASPTTPTPISIEPAPPAPSNPTSLAWGESVPAPAPPARFGGLLAVAGIVIVVLATASTIWLRRGREPRGPVAVAMPTTSSTAGVPDAPSQLPAQVSITVRVLPAEARPTVFLDDDLVTGERASVAWRSQPRRLRVSAPGFFTLERAVDATTDRIVEVTLDPDLAPSGGVARPPVRPSRKGTTPPVRVAAPTPRPKPRPTLEPEPVRRPQPKLAAPVQDL